MALGDDLRGSRPRAPKPAFSQREHPVGARWWEPLWSKLGLVCLVIFIGLVIGWLEPLFGPIGLPKDAPVEANRPQLQAAIRPAIDAFYADMSYSKLHEVERAIKRYRASFPDTLPGTYQAPSEKPDECNGSECAAKDRERAEGYAKITKSALASYASLPRYSEEYRKHELAFYALERRIPIQTALALMNEDWHYAPREKAAKEALEHLIRKIDEFGYAGQTQERFIFQEWKEKLDIYYWATQKTRAPMYTFRCGDAGRAEAHPDCAVARAEYERLDKDGHANPKRLGEKADLLKRILRERSAPKEFIEARMKNFFDYNPVRTY